MPCTLANIADAVVADFNAQDFGVELPAAERVWYPLTKLKEFAGIKVQVAAFYGDGSEAVSRNRYGDAVVVDVAVLHGKVSHTDLVTVDAWTELCERIRRRYRGLRLPSDPPVRFDDVQFVSVVENLKQFRVFTGVIRCKGQVAESI